MRFAIRTYGCQMNVHDSEKVTTLLEDAGLQAAEEESDADLLVINTCSIRDKAEHQLYSDLGLLRDWKAERPGRIVGVGGCVAQQVGDSLLGRFSHLDFVFGTHQLRRLPALLEGVRQGQRLAWIGEEASPDRFDLPIRRAEPRAGVRRKAFVTVMEGCDMFCSFCIVPTTRGREISRPAAEIEAEVRAQAVAAGTMPFTERLARLDAVPGLERIRYTSPHPLFYDEALTRAHRALPKLAPHVHLPVQSGSDRILRAMRRRYGRDRYLEIVAGLRQARPELALTTDLIVGFPGETEADFEATLELVREAGFVDSFSFKYSTRPGTTAANLPGAVPPEEAQRRLERLQALQKEQTRTYHESRVGETVRVLVEGDSRRGGGQRAGRDPQNRVVNVDLPAAAGVEAGALLDVRIVAATPHSLLGEPLDPTRRQRPGPGEPATTPPKQLC